MSEKFLNILCSVIVGIFVIFCLSYTVPAHPENIPSPKVNTYEPSETELTREEADVLEARNGTGRWAMPLEATPDHIDEEIIDDEISENFDLLCDVVFAESGNQGDKGMRLVADVIINRMRKGDTLHSVLTAKNQFSCVSDGGAKKWRGHEKEKVRKLVQQELANTSNTDVMYFRTGRYSDYGTPLFKYRDHYFSGKRG